MARVFTAQTPAIVTHHLENIAVTHFGASKRDIELFESQFEPKVAHQSAYHTVTTTSILLLIGCNDVEQLIAIDQLPFVIYKDYAIAVTIKGNTNICT